MRPYRPAEQILGMASGSAVVCWLGAATAGMGAASRRRSSHRTMTFAESESGVLESGRMVQVKAERIRDSMVAGASVATMDALMQASAADILAVGAERMEPVPEKPGLWHAFMQPAELAGNKAQVRLTLAVDTSKSGRVDVQVADFDVATSDIMTGDLVFEGYPKEFFSVTWKNSISWRGRGRHAPLRLIHTSRGSLSWVVPDWFPLPDSVVTAWAKAVAERVLQDGQDKIANQIAIKHAALSQV